MRINSGARPSFKRSFIKTGAKIRGMLILPVVLILVTGNSFGVVWATPNNTTADRVYGRTGGFTEGGTNADSLESPSDVAIASDGVYVADKDSHRVLFYPNNSTTATRVYGQKDSLTVSTSNNGGISATSLSEPRGIAVWMWSPISINP